MRSPIRGDAPEVGTILGGRYQLLSLIGRGGMGSVFLAKHTQLGKLLAVKVLETNRTGSEAIERLFREARAAASIGHPNIVDVNDVGFSEAGEPYLVMEFLEGEDLSSYVDRNAPLTPQAACGILEPVLLALSAAHRMGIVHRDLKPANIVIVKRSSSPLTVKLIDFGIAKLVHEPTDRQLTADGTLLGTPSYMSPEQARGMAEIDARADLYAAGVIFYQMLTRSLPFDGRNYNETLYRIVNDPPPDPDSLIEGLPRDAIAFIHRAIAKDKAERFQSADEMLEAIAALEAWSGRGEALTQMSSELHIRSSQSGGERRSGAEDKRVSPSSGPTVAEIDVAASTEGDGPPGGVDRQQKQTPARRVSPGPDAREQPRLSRSTALWSLLTLALCGALAWTALRSGTADPGNVAGPNAPSGASNPLEPVRERRVRITVTGTPPDAAVIFDGRAMSGTQFEVPQSETPTPLRVELTGYETFSTTIVPNNDTRLHVSLLPTPKPDVDPSPSETSPSASGKIGTGPKHESGRPNQQHAAPTPDATGQAEIHRGTRDTLYTEKFE